MTIIHTLRTIDTINMMTKKINKTKFEKLEVISVAEVFGESIKRIVDGTSLSSMFNF